MNWKLYLVIFTVFSLLVAVAYYYKPQGFQNPPGALLEKARFTICYADWCGHCKHAKPSFDEIEQRVANGSKVTVRRLNADDEANKSELSRLKVKGYPTLILETTDGKLIEFQGERTTQGYIDFLNKNLGGGI